MRKFILSLMFGVLAYGPLFASATSQTAPDFAIHQAGLPATLAKLKGKVVYLDFWASWCHPCRKSFPWMNAMEKKYASKGLQVVTVNLDTESKLARKFLGQLDNTLPVVFDPKGHIAEKYHIVAMPSSYLIDATGKIRAAHKGFFEARKAHYEKQINALLGEME